jgi:hypothetical protein
LKLYLFCIAKLTKPMSFYKNKRQEVALLPFILFN